MSVSDTASSAKIQLKHGTLFLLDDLQRGDLSAFQSGCEELARISNSKVILDLTKCTYVSSLFIGVLVEAVTQMKTDGKEVSVYVSPEVGRFLHMAHLYHLFTYQIVDTHLDTK